MLITRLTPPAQQSRLLLRPRIDGLLATICDYPVTVLVAPAGSGKTTALAGLIERKQYPVAWCRTVPDETAVSFLRHLVMAFRLLMGETGHRLDPVLAQLDQIEDSDPPTVILDVLVSELAQFLREDTLLVLDDYHHADRHPAQRSLIEYLISVQPKWLHLVLATRDEPRIESLPIGHARGEVNRIGQADLAFTNSESSELLYLYRQSVPDNGVDVNALNEEYHGWPLAMQMIVASMARGQQQFEGLPPELHQEPLVPEYAAMAAHMHNLRHTSLSPLLDKYLTQQVFDMQSSEMQNFLLRTACLRWFDAGICEVLPGLGNTAHLREDVVQRSLFIEQLPGGRLTYQPIFKRFLERLSIWRLHDRQELHQQAAEYYRTQGDMAGAIYHLIAIGEYAHAARILEEAAVQWIKQGRVTEVLTWLARLPKVYHYWPALLEARAAVNRHMGSYEQALTLYQEALTAYEEQTNIEGQVRVLRGRAEVYLDTVQPAPAFELLDKALALLPEERYAERAEILRMQAENWANRGRADVALQLEEQAKTLKEAARQARVAENEEQSEPTEPTQEDTAASLLLARLMLRSGRLNESLEQLEAQLGLAPQGHTEQTSSPLIHREPSLMLALVYALLGKDARALATARRALLEVQQGESQLTTAIAHMRLGHAYQVAAPRDIGAALRHYQEAMVIVERSGVPRTKVECAMGLVLLHGHRGDLASAEAIAYEAIQIAEESGDTWIAALIFLALGGAGVVLSDERALDWLEQALQRFAQGNDSYGQAVVTLWRALWYFHNGPNEHLNQHVVRLFKLAQRCGYEGLLTAATLFGPRDLAMLIPMLLQGRVQQEYSGYAQRLLRQAFPSVATDDMVEDYHPGYTLHIQMLGSFRVWRGIQEVQGREWQREKARQLLQLLLTYRGQWLQREQICSWLWPDSDLDAAERQFKVTLNALNAALEPGRPPRTMPFFVRRQGLAYSFAPSYGCWIDVDEFELRTTSVAHSSDPEFSLRNSQLAVNLYRGDYLTESLYDPWTTEERERLLARYLATATALASRFVERNDIEQAVELCEKVLRRDRCYEEAYQVLMRAYAISGSRSQALRTYMRCTQALEDELGIEPLPDTTELYEQIKQNEHV